MTRTCLCALALVATAAAACGEREATAPPPTSQSPAQAPPTERVVGPLSPEEAAALAGMTDRVNAYLELHRKIEDRLEGLPDNATPQQIDVRQRAFERAMREARAGARQGDLFTPEAQAVIKRLLATVFGGPDGAQLKASIMDENPVDVRVAVNARYPDTVPISTVPPEVLQTLPRLTEDMEYRFVGENLIILDAHAHIIADFIPDAFPK